MDKICSQIGVAVPFDPAPPWITKKRGELAEHLNDPRDMDHLSGSLLHPDAGGRYGSPGRWKKLVHSSDSEAPQAARGTALQPVPDDTGAHTPLRCDMGTR